MSGLICKFNSLFLIYILHGSKVIVPAPVFGKLLAFSILNGQESVYASSSVRLYLGTMILVLNANISVPTC